MSETAIGTADLHLHSYWSDGMARVFEIMAYIEERTSLNVVAIADHDQVAGALEAVEWCAGRPGGRVQAIVATEISAAWGRHVLALFFEEPFPTRPFPRFRSLARTLGMVHDHGGLAVIPHPFSALVPSVGERTLGALARRGHSAAPGGASNHLATCLAGIEVCSGVVGGRLAEARVRRVNAERWQLAEIGSSDAHHLTKIGGAYTTFPGATAAELRRAIESRQTRACWGPATRVPLAAHLGQSWRSLVVKPAREVRAALRSASGAPRTTSRG